MPIVTFERHVFQKMTDTRYVVSLVARPGPYKESRSHAVYVVGQFGNDLQTVGKLMLMKLHGYDHL